MDISDILASVTRNHVNDAASSGLEQDSQQQQHNDLQQLTRAWVAERVAPELLPYPTELMDRTMRRLRQQIETIEDSTARMDAGTSFGLIVIQTELERFKFLVRSFLRARIAKIDAHTLHILAMHTQNTDRVLSPDKPLLSPAEATYAQTHSALLERHYNASFLSSFPPKLRRLDDRAGAGGVGMVEGPDLDKAVFVRCLGRRGTSDGSRLRHAGYDMDDDTMDDGQDEAGDGSVEVSCGYTESAEPTGEDDGPDSTQRGLPEEKIVRMRKGDIWIVRWRGVREAVARGECELI